jgi:hypothetical protein
MNKIFLLVVVLAISLAGTQTVMAQTPVPTCDSSPCVYVNPEREPGGNEDGSQTSPYNTVSEGRAYAQSLPNGGYIYVRNSTTGNWEKSYVPPARSGVTGDPLPNLTLYVVLGLLAVVLIVTGWLMRRRTS